MSTAASSFRSFFEESAPLAIDGARERLSDEHDIEEVLLHAYLLAWARMKAAREWSVPLLLKTVEALSQAQTETPGEDTGQLTDSLLGSLERMIGRLEADGAPETRIPQQFYGLLPRVRQVLGSTERALEWMLEPNTALGDATPMEQLERDGGAAALEALLGRIEHGVFS